MSLKSILKIRHSLAFRLAILYAAVFTFSSLVAFSIFYITISKVIHENRDQSLSKEIAEMSSILKSRGEGSIQADMEIEAESEGVGDIFFRLLDMNGREIAATNMSDWKGVGVNRSALALIASGEKRVLETVTVPGKKYEARIIYGAAGQGRLLQIGSSLEDDARFLETFRIVFVPSIIVIMLVSTLIGWFMARHALSDVREVTRTALEISEGAFGKRVAGKSRVDEIEQLALAFNKMLDRIQALVKGMKEVTDDIAHDLRTPISRIRGLAESELNSAKLGSESGRLAADIMEECENLLQIINTMLEISEMESGISELAKMELDVAELIRDAAELFQPVAEAKGVLLESHLPDNFSICGSVPFLQRIIVNLLDNAVKYTPNGGSIEVSLKSVDHRVAIYVHDTGIGIAASELPLVFDRLYRCDSSRSQQGFGLGLSLALAAARAHGGDITAVSEPGEGSTFILTLPL